MTSLYPVYISGLSAPLTLRDFADFICLFQGIFFISHEQNGHISTSGQKSDVAVVFPDLDLIRVAVISVIREHLRQILRF